MMKALSDRLVNSKNKKTFRQKFTSFKRTLFGMKMSEGLVYKLVMYFLLIVIGFVFIYPILYMLSISLMSNEDLVDSTIKWIPSELNFSNYNLTFKALKLPASLFTSIFLAGISTLVVAISSSFIGFGLARFEFKGKIIIFILLIFSFIMPKTLFFIPTYQIYTTLKLKGTLAAILLPATVGQGLQASFFILIFYQFFRMIPKALEEAAILDGANSYKIYYKIALPMAVPAFIITFVYCFSLYWNETFLVNIYLDGKYKTIPMLLNSLEASYGSLLEGNGSSPSIEARYSEAKAFAGTILSIIPLIFMYAIVQKWFVESIDKSGITGE